MSGLTHVELLWLEKRIENWIRFGRDVEETILDRRRRILSFAPGSIFAFIRWASNDFGTVVSRIDIARAVAPGEPYATVPFVRPGGDILLRLTGWPKVQRVPQAIDAVEALGIDPADASPDIGATSTIADRGRPRLHAHPAQPGSCGGGRNLDRRGRLHHAVRCLHPDRPPPSPAHADLNASASVPVGLYRVEPLASSMSANGRRHAAGAAGAFAARLSARRRP